MMVSHCRWSGLGVAVASTSLALTSWQRTQTLLQGFASAWISVTVAHGGAAALLLAVLG